MPEKAAKEVGACPVAMAALNEMLEASLEVSSPKKAKAYLRALAARAATPTENVVPFGRRDMLAVAQARAWLEKRLPSWVSRYG